LIGIYRNKKNEKNSKRCIESSIEVWKGKKAENHGGYIGPALATEGVAGVDGRAREGSYGKTEPQNAVNAIEIRRIAERYGAESAEGLVTAFWRETS
jgi:hypothetical protein